MRYLYHLSLYDYNMTASKYQNQSPLTFKVILLGDSGVGKTCFIRQYILGEFWSHAKPTCNIDYATKTCKVDQFTVRLNIFDTAGQERYFSLTKSYLKGADAVLFLYAIDNKTSFENLNKWVTKFENESQGKLNDHVRVLVGTKLDLTQSQSQESTIRKNSLEVQQEIKQENEIKSQKSKKRKGEIKKQDMKQVMENCKITFNFETSAKLNKNIDRVFEELSRNLIYNSVKKKKYEQTIEKEEWKSILKKEKSESEKEEKGCCG